MDEQSAQLLYRYIQGEVLSLEDLAFLRSRVTRAQVEALATGELGRNGGSRRLFKLWNLLYARSKGDQRKAPSAPQAEGMFKQVRNAKGGQGGRQIVSGGGANGTSKRP